LPFSLEGRVPSRPAESSLCTLVGVCHAFKTVVPGGPLVEMELDLPENKVALVKCQWLFP